MESWIWISLSYATFGLDVRDGAVTLAPPIARWTIGKTVEQVERYYRNKGARIVRGSSKG